MSDPSPLGPGEPWPEELRVQNNGALLKVTFDDGVVGSVSPSACARPRPAPTRRASRFPAASRWRLSRSSRSAITRCASCSTTGTAPGFLRGGCCGV